MMKRNRNFDRATVNTNSLGKHRSKRLEQGYRRETSANHFPIRDYMRIFTRN